MISNLIFLIVLKVTYIFKTLHMLRKGRVILLILELMWGLSCTCRKQKVGSLVQCLDLESISWTKYRFARKGWKSHWLNDFKQHLWCCYDDREATLRKLELKTKAEFFWWCLMPQCFLILSCMSCLCFWMLKHNWSYYLQIFSLIQSIFLTISFAVQKLLSLNGSHLFIFALVSFAFRDRSKKILLHFMSNSILSMFSSRSFMVLGLIFRACIFHF